MEEQVLSIEQMKHLIELGVDTSKASMCYQKTSYSIDEPFEDELCIGFDGKNGIPTFTLQDILEMLPFNIMDSNDVIYILNVEKYEKFYRTTYVHRDGDMTKRLVGRIGDTILESAYKMLSWVLKKNHEKYTSK